MGQFLVILMMSVPLAGGQPEDDERLLREAVREGFEIVARFEPDIRLPRAELALAAGLLDGPQALAEIDALTTHAVRWGTADDALTLFRISTLTDLSGLLEPPGFGTKSLSEIVVSRWGREYVRALEAQRWEDLIETVWPMAEPDLVPHLAALAAAVRMRDAGLALGVAALARRHFGQLQPTDGLARDYAFILQLRDWIGEEEYRRGFSSLVERLTLLDASGSRYVLSTAAGAVPLTAPQFHAFELIRRAVESGRETGLETPTDLGLEARLAEVGGWPAVHEWYRRDRVPADPDPAPAEAAPPVVTGERMRSAVARIQTIEPLILKTPAEVRWEVRRLAFEPETLEDLLVLTEPESPIPDTARQRLIEVLVDAVFDFSRREPRAVVLNWLSRPGRRTEERLVRAWVAKDPQAARTGLSLLARDDLAGALGIARDQEDPRRKLQYLVWSVRDRLLGWRR